MHEKSPMILKKSNEFYDDCKKFVINTLFFIRITLIRTVSLRFDILKLVSRKIFVLA